MTFWQRFDYKNINVNGRRDYIWMIFRLHLDEFHFYKGATHNFGKTDIFNKIKNSENWKSIVLKIVKIFKKVFF